MAVKNYTYEGLVTAEKAAGDGGAVLAGGGAGALLVAALRWKGWALWPESMDVTAVGVATTLGGAAVATVKRAVRNYKKNRWIKRALVVGCLAGLGCLSGCETITMPDGTVVQRLDTETLVWAYGALREEREKPENAGRDWRDISITVDGQVWDAAALERELAARGVRVETGK